MLIILHCRIIHFRDIRNWTTRRGAGAAAGHAPYAARADRRAGRPEPVGGRDQRARQPRRGRDSQRPPAQRADRHPGQHPDRPARPAGEPRLPRQGAGPGRPPLVPATADRDRPGGGRPGARRDRGPGARRTLPAGRHPARRLPRRRHRLAGGLLMPHDELTALLPEITGSSGQFRHRQHIHLAFLAVRRYGMPEATTRICDWIQHIAAYERAPQKYHHTVSRAWVEIVAHHADADPDCADFGIFAERHPALLDKRLLARHYRSSTLAAAPACSGWVEPDLLPFPWSPASSRRSVLPDGE